MEDKIITFLALLTKYSNEYETELINLYKNYINQDELLNNALKKLENTIFYHNKGENLYNQIIEIINRYKTDVSSIGKNKLLLKSKIEELNTEINNTINDFLSCETNTTSINVISKEYERTITEYYRSIFNVLVYIYYMFLNSEKIQVEYPINDNSSNLNDIIRGKLIPEMLNRNFNSKSWIIESSFENINEIKISKKYRLCYTNYEFSDILKKYTNKLFISPNIIFDYDSNALIGTGNIVSLDIKNAKSFLGTSILREIPKYKLNDNMMFNNDPIHNLKLIMNENEFCISPNSYVNFLNSISDTLTVLERKNNKKCFICGRKITDGRVCQHHKIRITS